MYNELLTLSRSQKTIPYSSSFDVVSVSLELFGILQYWVKLKIYKIRKLSHFIPINVLLDSHDVQ